MAKKTKSDKIRALLDKGVSRDDIVSKLKVTPQLVYIVARNYGKIMKRPVKQSAAKDKKFISKLLALVTEYRGAA